MNMARQIAGGALAIALAACMQSALAQNWRAPNPDQPNGYRATEFDNRYHGDLHAPAQPLNGYRASEARSHYGGERYEPAGGWNYQYTNGPGSAFSDKKIDSGGPGSAFNSQPIENNGPGSAFSNASAFHNGGPENSLMERMRRANQWQEQIHNLRAAGYTPSTGVSNEESRGAQYGGYGQQYPQYTSFPNRFATYAPMIQKEQALRQRAIERVESGGGFNRIYTGQ